MLHCIICHIVQALHYKQKNWILLNIKAANVRVESLGINIDLDLNIRDRSNKDTVLTSDSL